MTSQFGPRSPTVIGVDVDLPAITCDVLVIGAGMGGSAVAYGLRDSGANVLVVERGTFLPREPENWDASEVFERQRYATGEAWRNRRTGSDFFPGIHYHIGGNTKFYGACLPRFREEDFGTIQHAEGVSPAWPVSYDEMEQYYCAAEQALLVHGDDTGDRTAPRRSRPYPFPAVAHEPAVDALARSWAAQGLHPVAVPVGIDLRPNGSCLRCRTCDGFPCAVGAKADAETSFLAPATVGGSIKVMTHTRVTTLNKRGTEIVSVFVRRGNATTAITAGRVVLAAGAVNTAAILLGSGDLANSSGLVGRNYMVHNSTFFVAVDPRRKNTTQFQKTLGLNDWYTAGPTNEHPLGNIQMLGKLQTPMVRAARRRVPRRLLDFMTDHSIDLYLTSEDLPSTRNGVHLGGGGQIEIEWEPGNLGPHRELVARTKTIMRSAGYPILFTERMGIETNSHMCGTAVMGSDPCSSVVDPSGKAHDLDNLWISDSSVFPSSAALNPALTIAANALRVSALMASTW